MSRIRLPFRRSREPFGKAGLIVAMVALVFAMVGGAFAAGALTAKQKKEVERIAKRLAGKSGADGAAGRDGAPGTVGSQGPTGPAGASVEPTEAVHSVTLANCVGSTKWTGAPGFAQQPVYWKDPTGLVHLQGAVSCSGDATEGNAIFNLPAGYGPNKGVVRFGVLGGGAKMVQIGILDDGSRAVVFDGPNDTTVDDYVSLDGITFRP